MVEKNKQKVVPNYILDQAVRLHGHTAHILIEGMLVPGNKDHFIAKSQSGTLTSNLTSTNI